MSRSAIRHLLPGRGARAAPPGVDAWRPGGTDLYGARHVVGHVRGPWTVTVSRAGRAHGACLTSRASALPGRPLVRRPPGRRPAVDREPACCTTRRPPATPERGGDRVDLSTRAVVTACSAAVVAVAAFFGPSPLTIASGASASGVAIGWPRSLDIPVHGGTRVVIAIAGLGAVAATAATHGEPASRHSPVVLALSVVLAFVAESSRRDGRPRLVESLIGTVSGIVVATSSAGWIAAGRTDAGESLVVTTAVALAVASAVSASPLGGWLNAASTLGLAVLAGGAVGYVMPDLESSGGVWAGVVAGSLVASSHALFDQLPESRGRSGAFSATASPVAVGGTSIFVVGRVIVGGLASPAADVAGPAPVDWAAHGVALAERRTFVQFSAELCAPCRATARVSRDVSAAHPDVTHREMDVDDHLDSVRAFGISRTPTVLVLDAEGREVARASGGMNRAQALAALAVADPGARPASETRVSDQAGPEATVTEPGGAPAGIDPRGPRAGAGMTAVSLAVVISLWTSPAALVSLAVVAAGFSLGTVRGAQGTWQAAVYRSVSLPRIGPTTEREDPRPPRFAQAVGLVITGAGVVLGSVGVAGAVPAAAALALVAAVLNAAFGSCLGCESYSSSRRVAPAR
ncbi:hypothetical protein OY671_003592 [Metschnikowia pulcherrima]|nr:hypothetical protein OY671_003592 [Metschnikowia pulcherrima]